MMPPRSPTVRRRRLGQELRALREAAGMTVEEAGARLDSSGSKISRMETTGIRIRLVDLRELLRVYGVTDPVRVDGLITLCRESQESGWWARRVPESLSQVNAEVSISYEAEASTIKEYQALLVPGLLQIPDYTRAVLQAIVKAPPEEFDAGVKLRQDRQAILRREEDPPWYDVVLDEAALRRPLGGRARRKVVMRDQVRHLIEVAALPRVSLQILPFDAGAHPGMAGSFTIFELPHPDDPTVVVLESSVATSTIEETDQVKTYQRIFGGIRAEAYGQDESREFLQDLESVYSRSVS